MVTIDRKIRRTRGIEMKKIRHYLAGSIFAVLGAIFLYLDVTPPVDHMDHNPTGHDVKLLGIGEMTWMWFTMALVHFFLNDR